MCSIWREEKREEGQKQCHYLNISAPACLDRQDLHVGFSAGAPGRVGKSQGGVWWEEIVVFVVLGVWQLWEQGSSQQGALSTGHTADLKTHTDVTFTFFTLSPKTPDHKSNLNHICTNF